MWYAGAQLASATTTGAGAATTRYAYDAFGALASVRIEDARARDVTFVSDTNGQAIRRDEADGLTTQGDPHERWYRFGGVEIGHVGNNGAQPADYARSVDARGRSAGSLRLRHLDDRHRCLPLTRPDYEQPIIFQVFSMTLLTTSLSSGLIGASGEC